MTNFSKLYTGKPTNADLANVEIIADRIDNIESALSGDTSLTTIDINGGIIDGCPIGINSYSTLTATCITCSTVEAYLISITDSLVLHASMVCSALSTYNKNFTTNSNLVCSATITVASNIYCDGITNCESFSTDGNEVLKMDILSFTNSYTCPPLTFTTTVAHGKSTSIRGCSNPEVRETSSTGDLIYITGIQLDNTNVVINFGIAPEIGGIHSYTGTGYIIVYYV